MVALKGALGDDDGITAAIGTGSVFGVQRGGRVRMIGGWGFQLGDHGSGAAMGRALCDQALLAHDGEVERDAGAGAAPRRAWRAGRDRGLGQGSGAGATSHGWCRASSRPRRRAIRRPRRSWREAEADIARAIDRLMADGPAPVAFLGGLGPVFAARLGRRYAGLMRAPKGSGLDGALADGAEAKVSAALFRAEDFADEGAGPLYLRLTRRIGEAIEAGALKPGESLPPERELAALTGLSRVTVRKAVQTLVQARAAGAAAGLGHLRGAARGEGRAGAVAADVVLRGHGPAGQERALDLAVAGRAPAIAGGDDGAGADRARPGRAARAGAARRRGAARDRAGRALDGGAARPDGGRELALRGAGRAGDAPGAGGAADLGGQSRAARCRAARGAGRRRGLRIERVSHLPSGRVVEFTRSLYRGDAYDFAAELHIPADTEGKSG